MRIPMTVIGAVALASSLGACGGSESGADGGDYCAQVKEASETFRTLDADNFAQVVDTYHQLADEAPDEIDAEWRVLDTTMTAVDTALRAAGITFNDMSKTPTGGSMEGADPSKVQDLRTAASALNSAEFTEAATAVQAHAKDVCDVDLSGS